MFGELTALLSVETPEMTNIKRKVMMISRTKDWTLDPTGTVPKKASGVISNIRSNVQLARRDPAS